LYTNPKRNKQLVAVVADPFDIVALEKTGSFNGTYHVLAAWFRRLIILDLSSYISKN